MSTVWIGLLGTLLVALAACDPSWSYNPEGFQQPVVDAIGGALPHPVCQVAMVVGVTLLCWAWWRERPRGVGEERSAEQSDTRALASIGRPRPARSSHNRWVLLGVWSIPLLLAPPVLTADPFAYADSGWLFLHGLNPYTAGYGAIGGPFAASVDPLWEGVGVAYPPLQFLINAAMVALAGGHPYWSVVALRLPALAGVALIAVLVPRIVRLVAPPPLQGAAEFATIDLGASTNVPSPRAAEFADKAVWLGVLNPILVVHFIGGAHNDAIMVGISILAIWVTLRARDMPRRWIWQFLVAPALVGVAMALKQQAGLTVIAVAGLPVVLALSGPANRRVVPTGSSTPDRLGHTSKLGGSRLIRVWLWTWRLAIVTAVAVGVFMAVSLATGLGFGWVEWMDQMGRTGTAAPFNLLGQIIDGLVPGTSIYKTLGVVSTIFMLGALVWCFFRYIDAPLKWLGWGALWFTILGSALHPWYVVWPLALLALTPVRRRPWAALVVFVLGFALWNSLQTVLFPSVAL